MPFSTTSFQLAAQISGATSGPGAAKDSMANSARWGAMPASRSASGGASAERHTKTMPIQTSMRKAGRLCASPSIESPWV